MAEKGNRINLAGEFYAMHRFFLEGYEATLTLGNTKSVDILLLNPRNGKQFKVEVKTSTTTMNEKLFGKTLSWIMNKKHEEIKDNSLNYCFVYMPKDKNIKSRIFIVPSKDVAEYVVWQHQHWLKAEHKKEVKDSDMRRFRIALDKPSPYEDNFKVFE